MSYISSLHLVITLTLGDNVGLFVLDAFYCLANWSRVRSQDQAQDQEEVFKTRELKTKMFQLLLCS